MDIASIIGIIGGISIVVYSIMTGDPTQGAAAIFNFADLPSVEITFGGALCAVLASHSMSDFLNGIKSVRLVFKSPILDAPGIIKMIIGLSNVARKEGLLSLEEAASDLEDEFLKKGVLLIVDGTDPELVRAILETELMSIEDRHKGVIGFWDTMAAMGPAWGMIGTLIGLINMLQNMSDASTIGPSMSTALVTTFYGSMLANWFSIPISSKLKANNNAEVQVKEIMIEGLLSIQAGENPRVIEEKLKSFLAPKDKSRITEASGGEN